MALGGYLQVHGVAVEAQLFSDSSIRPSLDLEEGRLKDGRIFAIIAVLTGVQFLSSLSNGFLTVGLPRMASGSFPSRSSSTLAIWRVLVGFLDHAA
jgi:hypothetical protein